jgi:hypothetical protein
MMKFQAPGSRRIELANNIVSVGNLISVLLTAATDSLSCSVLHVTHHVEYAMAGFFATLRPTITHKL